MFPDVLSSAPEILLASVHSEPNNNDEPSVKAVKTGGVAPVSVFNYSFNISLDESKKEKPKAPDISTTTRFV